MGFWGVSNAARVRYRNQSTSLCRTQVGHMASLAKKSIAYTLRSYPSANLWNPELKAGVTEVHWSVEIQQPTPPLSDSRAVQINGATALLLQADMGWDKWLHSWSLCVAAAEPPWNSLHSIWCPSPLPALHVFLLKDLVVLEPNSSKFKTPCNLWKWKELSVSHKFSEASRLNSLCCCRLTWAEINGIAAFRCVAAAEPPRNSLHSIWCPSPLPALHMLLLKDLVILKPNSYKFKAQCNLWKWKELSVSHKFSEASRLNSLFCCRLTWAEINSFRAGRCVWRPPSRHEILFIPYDIHLHFLLFTCLFWKS